MCVCAKGYPLKGDDDGDDDDEAESETASSSEQAGRDPGAKPILFMIFVV
jgi:hypothetical protein